MFYDGFCPQCQIERPENGYVEMILNRGDFWECPKCRLQIAGPTRYDTVVILRKRGEGNLRKTETKATNHAVGCLMSGARSDDPCSEDMYSGPVFDNEDELRGFLEEVR